MNKVGKSTPVFKNTRTKAVVCGATIKEALNVSWLWDVSEEWQRVKELPFEERVVIQCGIVLPKNPVTTAIAKNASRVGKITVNAFNREYNCVVTYVDKTKVIIK